MAPQEWNWSFPFGFFVEVVLLDLGVAALVVREELALVHLEREERGLLARQILGAQANPVEVLAALVDDRLGEVDLDVDQLVQHGVEKVGRLDEVGEDLRVADHVLRLLEQPAAPALAHERERRLVADELAVLAKRHAGDGGIVEHRGVPGVGPRVRLQLAQALLERRAGGVEQRVADHLVVAALLVRRPLADDPPFVDVDLDVGRRDAHVEGHFLELDGAESGGAAGGAGGDAHEVELELRGQIELEAHVRGPGGGAGPVVLRVGLVVHPDAAPQVLVPLDGAPEPDRHPVRLAQRKRIEDPLPLRWNRLADDRCHRSPPACRRLAEAARIREMGPLMQFGNEIRRTRSLPGTGGAVEPRTRQWQDISRYGFRRRPILQVGLAQRNPSFQRLKRSPPVLRIPAKPWSGSIPRPPAGTIPAAAPRRRTRTRPSAASSAAPRRRCRARRPPRSRGRPECSWYCLRRPPSLRAG